MDKKDAPYDIRLLQESFEKVAEGPQALMEWAREHKDQLDQKFFNLLTKFIEYSKKTGQSNLAEAFTFIKTCFEKMFEMQDLGPIVVTQENFEKIWHQSTSILEQGKPKQAMILFNAMSMFLMNNRQSPYYPLLQANMGIAHAQAKQYEQACECLENALHFPLSDVQKEKIFANLGAIYRERGDIEKSVDYYLKAIEISENLKLVEHQILHLNNLAIAEIERNQPDQAILYQRRAAELAERLGNPRLHQDTLTRMAILLGLQGNATDCKDLCAKALQLSLKIQEDSLQS